MSDIRKWKATVHYFNAEEGKRNELHTKSTMVEARILIGAVENALEEWLLLHEETGSFQITVSTHDHFGDPLR